ncbi:MAG TPA: hypothetical protein DD383_02965 [Rikenellaceae bacterium]|nr:hypothetical protein [Rikenellaceae bacterium]
MLRNFLALKTAKTSKIFGYIYIYILVPAFLIQNKESGHIQQAIQNCGSDRNPSQSTEYEPFNGYGSTPCSICPMIFTIN